MHKSTTGSSKNESEDDSIDNDMKEILERREKKKLEIEDALKNLASIFKIDGLWEDLNEIFIKFREIRNKFGKKEATKGEKNKKLLEDFKNSPHRSINTRLLVDLLKAFHNALIVMEKMGKENINNA